MRTVFSFLLVLPVVVFCCDETTHYQKDGQCCKMCGPGFRMKQNNNCDDPFCQACVDGEYQDQYTKDTKCKRQPICDPNLNFERPSKPSTTEYQPCRCHSGHHCSSEECISCVKNTECQPGEVVVHAGDMRSDTSCAPCDEGKYSNTSSAKTCLPWTECAPGHVETVKGSSTSDRICEPQSNTRLGILIFVGALIIVGVVVAVVCKYKRDKMGSAHLTKKLQQHCPALFKGMDDNHQPAVLVPREQEPLTEPLNLPQEDMDETKLDEQYKYGLSANGMPVGQDHSKISIVSETETHHPSSQSFSDRL